MYNRWKLISIQKKVHFLLYEIYFIEQTKQCWPKKFLVPYFFQILFIFKENFHVGFPNTLWQELRWKISGIKIGHHFSSQQLLQDKSHDGLNTFNKSAFFQCDKEVISFSSNEALKLNTVYKQEFTLTNTSGKELEIELFTVGFREPHEIVFSPNCCITTILLIFAQFISRWMRQRRLKFLQSFLTQQNSTRPRQESGVQSETKEALVICSVLKRGQQCPHTSPVMRLNLKSVLVVERIFISFLLSKIFPSAMGRFSREHTMGRQLQSKSTMISFHRTTLKHNISSVLVTVAWFHSEKYVAHWMR